MESTLSRHFPPKKSPKPNTTGGFLGYPAITRTLPPATLTENTRKDGCLLKFEPMKRQLSNEEILRNELIAIRTTGHVQFNPVGNRKIETAEQIFTEPSPILLKSFPNTPTGPLGIKKIPTSDVGIQSGRILEKKNMHGLSEYTGWMIREVDPFLIALRDAITENKPLNVAEYTMAFALSYNSGAGAPKTEIYED